MHGQKKKSTGGFQLGRGAGNEVIQTDPWPGDGILLLKHCLLRMVTGILCKGYWSLTPRRNDFCHPKIYTVHASTVEAKI